MKNELLLLSKNDIPFPEAQVNIHQPTIKEISLIGEETFFAACQLLFFSKEKIDKQDRTGLEDLSDFDILMSIVENSKDTKYKSNIESLLTLLFPNYRIKFMPTEIILFSNENSTRINNMNFEAFKKIIGDMFILSDELSQGSYNPVDDKAKKIAEKLRKAKQKKDAEEGKKDVSVFSRFISILSVGESKNMNELLEYSVFQLKDEFSRYQKKFAFDMYIKQLLAGAQNLEQVDNWMDEIHP